MITDFIKSYTELIVSNPESIEVDLHEVGDNFYEITIYCEEEDLGKIIGKSGNMINALKTIVNGCKAKDGKSYKIQVIKL
ncbi:MAG: KH domain-containing protein [Arcobacteraceae bacterium]|jgi:predicted RNA-binding protein YlqC (UPF0109 family)|nr:KH domain-containing protein [Arcobacteraceae bacterium]